MTVSTIDSTETLRRDTAKLGMVLFGLRQGHPVPDLDRQISRGIQICDMLSEWQRLSEARDESLSVKEAAFLERITPMKKRKRPTGSEEWPRMTEKARDVRMTLERILRCELVEAEEFTRCSEFCHSLYESL
jgi:hypothetical protein